jgi:hypothetical protein
MKAKQPADRGWIETSDRNLQDPVETPFPITCPTCEKVYPNKGGLLTKTLAVRDITREDRSSRFRLTNPPLPSHP